MSDRVVNYLTGLQSGYRINSIIYDPIPDNSRIVVAKFNPYRVALHLSFSGLGLSFFGISLPDGQFMPLNLDSATRFDATWTMQPHLVYQEYIVFDSINGQIWGFEVIKG